MKKLWTLFITFAKIGAFTFGGGMAMLAVLQDEITEKRKWAAAEEMLDYYAIAQCTPGVIAVNTATFIGTKQAGIAGGIAATLGVVFPSVIVITVIAAFLRNFLEYEIVKHILNGVKVAVAVIIVNALISLGKTALTDKICIGIAAVSFVLSAVFSVSPIYTVIAAAAAGILIKRGEKA